MQNFELQFLIFDNELYIDAAFLKDVACKEYALLK